MTHFLNIKISMIKRVISLSRKSGLLTKNTQSPFSELKKFENNFLSTTNLDYIESLYEKWLDDKSSVSPSFQTYFELLEKGEDPESAYFKPPAAG